MNYFSRASAALECKIKGDTFSSKTIYYLKFTLQIQVQCYYYGYCVCQSTMNTQTSND